MKNYILLMMVLVMTNTSTIQKVSGQDSSKEAAAIAGKEHKIVFQLTTDDTTAHKALMKQLNNIITVSPASMIEVVCHGPGLGMLIAGKTLVQEKIQQLKKKNIAFVACEFSMSERNVTKDKMIPEAGFVKFGILEIVSRQEEGWSYIRSGF